jgi:hypothetical protein
MLHPFGPEYTGTPLIENINDLPPFKPWRRSDFLGKGWMSRLRDKSAGEKVVVIILIIVFIALVITFSIFANKRKGVKNVYAACVILAVVSSCLALGSLLYLVM